MDENTTNAEARARLRGELAAAHYTGKSIGIAARNCPGKHGLIVFTTERSFGCNLCKKRFTKGIVMHGCRSCDYDVCTTCAGVVEKVENSMPRARLPRSQASYEEVLEVARDKAKQRKVELDYADTILRLAAQRAAEEEEEATRRKRQ